MSIHRTKDGKTMLISDMDDRHLLNTLGAIKRRAKNDKEKLERANYQAYLEEAMSRPTTRDRLQSNAKTYRENKALDQRFNRIDY